MSSIGPQLPPHLQKRKRTPEDDSRNSAPPAKSTRQDNEDEIPLDDENSSDDGYGPSAPAPSASRPSIGPSLPPDLAKQDRPPTGPSRPGPQIGPSLPPATSNTDEIPLDGSDSDDTGPAPPPAPRRVVGPAPPPKRVLGPAPPPADLSQRPTTDPDFDSDSDSDDGYGPALPSATRTALVGPSLPSAAFQASAPAAPKRDDWMVAPPTSSGYREVDPTKIRSRKFASGRSAGDKPSGVSSIWTETPEEKARRLANAVLGREDPSNTPIQGSTAKSSASRRADEEKIRAFTEQTRGRSLVEEHQAKKKAVNGGDGKGKGEEEEDDPSKRAFDWEKDMKVGGQISNSQRQQMVNRAANFGGRFQKGSFL